MFLFLIVELTLILGVYSAFVEDIARCCICENTLYEPRTDKFCDIGVTRNRNNAQHMVWNYQSHSTLYNETITIKITWKRTEGYGHWNSTIMLKCFQTATGTHTAAIYSKNALTRAFCCGRCGAILTHRSKFPHVSSKYECPSASETALDVESETSNYCNIW